MPHSTRALVSMHEPTIDGTRIEAEGLLFPLRLEIYVQVEGRKKNSHNLMSVGEAWRFINANMGVEAEVYLDEDKIPPEVRDWHLYPGIDLSTLAVNGNERGRLIYKAEVKAIYLEAGSPWDRMPPIYWPETAPVQYATGVARAVETLDVIDPVPPQRETESEPWFPWNET